MESSKIDDESWYAIPIVWSITMLGLVTILMGNEYFKVIGIFTVIMGLGVLTQIARKRKEDKKGGEQWQISYK